MPKKRASPFYLYEEILKKLAKAEVRYLVIGGFAVGLYGIPRPTNDIDFMLALDEENIKKFVKISNQLGLKPKVPADPLGLADPPTVKKWQKRNMKVFSFIHPNNPYIIVDIMTEKYLDFEKAYKQRRIIPSFGVTISVIGIDDLIALKKIAGRDQDLSDIAALRRLKK